MFDIIKDYSAQLVTIDQVLTTYGTEFYTKISVDVEVVKNQRDNDFRTLNVNPRLFNCRDESEQLS